MLASIHLETIEGVNLPSPDITREITLPLKTFPGAQPKKEFLEKNRLIPVLVFFCAGGFNYAFEWLGIPVFRSG